MKLEKQQCCGVDEEEKQAESKGGELKWRRDGAGQKEETYCKEDM